jgi:hypothetical protein
MKAPDRDLAFAVALALLIAVTVAAFFCDPHWRPTGNPRITWAGTSPRNVVGGGSGQ